MLFFLFLIIFSGGLASGATANCLFLYKAIHYYHYVYHYIIYSYILLSLYTLVYYIKLCIIIIIIIITFYHFIYHILLLYNGRIEARFRRIHSIYNGI